MLPKSYIVAKWTVYSLATLLLFGVQFLIFDHVSLWGVIPFTYPILPAVAAMYEGLRRGSVFALCVGIVCGLLLPGPFPGFYALVFVLSAILSARVAEFLLAPGWLCGLAVSAMSLVLCSFGRILFAALTGAGHLGLMARLGLMEALISLPALLPALPLYRFIHRRCAAAY